MSVNPPTGPVPSRTRTLTPYVVIWVLMAGAAAAYLSLLGLRPELLAALGNGGPDATEQLAQNQREMSRAIADLDPLRRTVGELKLDVANLKIVAKEFIARDNLFEDRITALEKPDAKRPEVTRISDATPTSSTTVMPPEAAPPAPRPDPRRSANTVVAPMPTEEGPSSAPAGSAPKAAQVINKKPPAAIETGSIERKEKVAAPKPTPAAKPPAALLLATGPSVDALRLNWTIINDRHGDAVKNLQPRYTVGGTAQQRVYSLVAGPVASRAEATKICSQMAQKGIACEVGTFRGNAL